MCFSSEKAVFLGVRENVGVFVLKSKCNVKKQIRKATVYATALGLYRLRVGGREAGDICMAPGWTDYRRCLQVQGYDITALLRPGENLLEMTVAQGWYCGEIGYRHTSKYYGECAAGYLYLEAEYTDGTREEWMTGEDAGWSACESPVRSSGIYAGERADYTRPLARLTVCRKEYDRSKLVMQQCEPVRVVERIPAKRCFITPEGERVYDFGQNLSGTVELALGESVYPEIKVRHAEVLDKEGNFYTENLRGAAAEDTYIGAAGTVSPLFTYHGFRYAAIEGAELPAERVTALVTHTDLRRTGRLTVSNRLFGRFLENIIWSQKGNFFDIPTDCPQRDERLGWTADANVFCRTAAFQYDVSRFFKKWLADFRSGQAETGELPVVVPDALQEKNTAALWADSIAMIPWALYEMYGDLSFLSDNMGAISKYIQAAEKRMENGLIVCGFQYGDWLGLDREESMPEIGPGATDSYFVANVFFSETLRIAADASALLGDAENEKNYRQKREKLLAAMRQEYFSPTGRSVGETQTAMTLALYFGIAPEQHRKRIAARLNENIKAHGYHLTTGFAGTPYLLFALSDNGYHDTAAKVLMNKSYPGWLYEVENGATTIWERWNGIRTDGTFYSPAMNSFNHYAYGSVGEFVWRRIAGIDCTAPGFSAIKIAPTPTAGVQSIRAEFESVHGKIVSGYEWKEGKIEFFASVPANVAAEICFPGEQPEKGTGGEYRVQKEWGSLAEEGFTEATVLKDILDDKEALAAFNAVSDNMFLSERIRSLQNCSLKELSRFLGACGGEKMTAMIRAANRIYLKET